MKMSGRMILGENLNAQPPFVRHAGTPENQLPLAVSGGLRIE